MVTLIYRLMYVLTLTRIPTLDSGLCYSIMYETLNNFPGFEELLGLLLYFYPSLLTQSYQCPEGLVVLMFVYFRYVKSRGSNIPILFIQIYLKLKLGCKVSISLNYLICLQLSFGCIFLFTISL